MMITYQDLSVNHTLFYQKSYQDLSKIISSKNT